LDIYNYYFFSFVNIHRKADVVGSKLSNFALHPVSNINIIINLILV